MNSMCHIPGYRDGLLIEPIAIGAGPHISAFYSVQFPHGISDNVF